MYRSKVCIIFYYCDRATSERAPLSVCRHTVMFYIILNTRQRNFQLRVKSRARAWESQKPVGVASPIRARTRDRTSCARSTTRMYIHSCNMHRSYDITLTSCEHAPTQLFLCVVLAVQHVRQMIRVQTTHSRNTQTSHTNMNSALHQHKKHNRAGGS